MNNNEKKSFYAHNSPDCFFLQEKRSEARN